jgi:hypothetical protein
MKCTHPHAHLPRRKWAIESRVARWHIFKPKSQFGQIFKGLIMEDAGIFLVIRPILPQFGIFCGHLVYFVAIWYILWPFDIFVAIWYIVLPFGMFW